MNADKDGNCDDTCAKYQEINTGIVNTKRRDDKMKIAIVGISALLLLLADVSQAWADVAQNAVVKVAVASTGRTAAASVSNVAAHCPYYIIFDGTGKLTEVISNPHQDTARGAGPSAAHYLAAKGVTIVIAENFGIKMINVLKGNRIKHFELEGQVAEAVSKVLELK